MEQQAFEQHPREVDMRLPFRTGWPMLPVLPVESNTYDVYVDPDDYEPVKAILIQNEVYFNQVFFAYRYNKGTPISERRRTLVVISDILKGQNIDKWRQAVRDVCDMLEKRGDSDFTVEITDYRAYRPDDLDKIETDLIMPDEKEVLDAWTNLGPHIVQLLSGHNYLSIDLLHRSWIGSQGFKATVVICAVDANDQRWWDETLPKLRELLPGFLGIELFYLRAICSSQTSDQLDDIRDELDMLRYERPKSIHMGASCGPRWKGEKSKAFGAAHLSGDSGTLGGSIEFKDGVTQQFGLSNHHVFFEGKGYDVEGKDTMLKALRHGDDSLSSEIPVCSPSNADRDQKTAELQLEIGKTGAKYEYHKDNPEADITATQSKLDIFNAQNDKVKALDPDIGIIYASSGRRSIRNEATDGSFRGTWESDWCLIQIKSGITLDRTTPALWCNEPAQANTYQTISPFHLYNVMKFGRTTGKTVGTISAAITHYRKATDDLDPLPVNTETNHSVSDFGKPLDRVLRLEDGNQEGTSQTRMCYAIRTRQKGRYFMEKGDSGCFVLLDQNAQKKEAPIVGLGFGSNEMTRMAYMTPFDLVIKDIQEVTGRTVVQPKHNGNATPTQRPTMAGPTSEGEPSV